MKTLSTTPRGPNRRTLLGAMAGGLLVPPFAAGTASTVASARDDALADVLRASWEARYGGKGGGLTMLVQAADGDHFASTLAAVTPHSFFRGASITKTFTAASIMILDQRGKLRIDDQITDPIPGRSDPYLPEGPGFAIPYRDRITIRQLLSHRAGVFDLTNTMIPRGLPFPYAGDDYTGWRMDGEPEHSFTTDELIGVLAETQLSYSAPGESQHYSDTHYTLLERIVQNVSGLSRDQFKISELLEPNHLDNTHFVVDGHDTRLPEPAIAGFTIGTDGIIATQNYNYTYDPGSGNLVTTPADLVQWMSKLIRGEAGVTASQIARMIDMQPGSDYGLGILRKSSDGVFLGYGHNGGTAGYLTDALHNPQTGITYVLQCALLDFPHVHGQLDWLGVVARNALQRLDLI